MSFLRKLRTARRLVMERWTEPLHVNVASAFVALCGTYRTRIAHDLVLRPQNAYAILYAADQARAIGAKAISLVEFGVAAGAGLMNMARIATRVSRMTGIAIRVYGFDTGTGLPAPTDFRDHPDLYSAADFPMDQRALSAALPHNASLILGDVKVTIPQFIESLSIDEPIGYIAVDLDYYSSTKHALEALVHSDSRKYLPVTAAYFDDIYDDRHNSWSGELLAIGEFNNQHQMRKIERNPFLQDRRIYRRARWIKQMFHVHVLDHPLRNAPSTAARRVLSNPYL